MQFDTPLTRGTLLKRYKRFLADVELETGEVVTAHCANTGAMVGLKDEGMTVHLSPNTNPKAKLGWRWEAVELDGGVMVGINTAHPNKLVEEAILAGKVPALSGYQTLKREVKYGKNSRIDILLSDPEKPDCYVEVKNVHLCRTAGLAEFPDSVTARGAKHLGEMADMVRNGHRAVMVYLVQRNDCDRFALAADYDPDYAKAFRAAKAAGVEALALACEVTNEKIEVVRGLTLDL